MTRPTAPPSNCPELSLARFEEGVTLMAVMWNPAEPWGAYRRQYAEEMGIPFEMVPPLGIQGPKAGGSARRSIDEQWAWVDFLRWMIVRHGDRIDVELWRGRIRLHEGLIALTEAQLRNGKVKTTAARRNSRTPRRTR